MKSWTLEFRTIDMRIVEYIFKLKLHKWHKDQLGCFRCKIESWFEQKQLKPLKEVER